MSICQSSNNGEHRWEWHAEAHGTITYVCMNANCGEVREQYIDCGSGY